MISKTATITSSTISKHFTEVKKSTRRCQVLIRRVFIEQIFGLSAASHVRLTFSRCMKIVMKWKTEIVCLYCHQCSSCGKSVYISSTSLLVILSRLVAFFRFSQLIPGDDLTIFFSTFSIRFFCFDDVVVVDVIVAIFILQHSCSWRCMSLRLHETCLRSRFTAHDLHILHKAANLFS